MIAPLNRRAWLAHLRALAAPALMTYGTTEPKPADERRAYFQRGFNYQLVTVRPGDGDDGISLCDARRDEVPGMEGLPQPMPVGVRLGGVERPKDGSTPYRHLVRVWEGDAPATCRLCPVRCSAHLPDQDLLRAGFGKDLLPNIAPGRPICWHYVPVDVGEAEAPLYKVR